MCERYKIYGVEKLDITKYIYRNVATRKRPHVSAKTNMTKISNYSKTIPNDVNVTDTDAQLELL